MSGCTLSTSTTAVTSTATVSTTTAARIAAPPKSAQRRRIEREWMELETVRGAGGWWKDPPPGCFARPTSADLLQGDCLLVGPAESAYASYGFHLIIKLKSDYPFKAPHLQFISKILHPNITKHGEICLDAIDNVGWSPAFTLKKALIMITNLLALPRLDDIEDPEMRLEIKSNPTPYFERARQYAKKYADPIQLEPTEVPSRGAITKESQV